VPYRLKQIRGMVYITKHTYVFDLTFFKGCSDLTFFMECICIHSCNVVVALYLCLQNAKFMGHYQLELLRVCLVSRFA
jgi:hypothetical protein